jgi:hypothetical protein
MEDVRAAMLRAIASADVTHGVENEIPGLRAAIEAWPDRRLFARLPAEVKAFLEKEFGGET